MKIIIFDITECCKTHKISLKNEQLKRFFLSQAIIENDCDGLKNFATIVVIDKIKLFYDSIIAKRKLQR